MGSSFFRDVVGYEEKWICRPVFRPPYGIDCSITRDCKPNYRRTPGLFAAALSSNSICELNCTRSYLGLIGNHTQSVLRLLSRRLSPLYYFLLSHTAKVSFTSPILWHTRGFGAVSGEAFWRGDVKGLVQLDIVLITSSSLWWRKHALRRR